MRDHGYRQIGRLGDSVADKVAGSETTAVQPASWAAIRIDLVLDQPLRD